MPKPKKKSRAKAPRENFLARWPNLVWGLLALAAWAGEQYWRWRHGVPLSAASFLKGVLLLAGAAGVYQLSSPRGFSTLGLFPLLWLALSGFQWDLCGAAGWKYWIWLCLFLAGEVLVAVLPDGKRLLAVLASLWTALSWISPLSLLLPLSFVTAPPNRLARAGWIKWGGLGAGAALFLLFQGWHGFLRNGMDSYDLFIGQRYVSFFLLGWLGLVSFPRRGTGRHLVFPLFALSLGFLFWAGSSGSGPWEAEMLKWVLVFLAGFGLESVKRDLMDDSWHGRAVWGALGIAFFGGVL